MLPPIDKLGPGMWFMIHLQAATATTAFLRNAYRANMQALLANFPCPDCRAHFATIMQRRDDELLRCTTNEQCLRWSMDVHNDVNLRLTKPPLEWADVRQLYLNNDGSCGGVCRPEPEESVLDKGRRYGTTPRGLWH